MRAVDTQASFRVTTAATVDSVSLVTTAAVAALSVHHKQPDFGLTTVQLTVLTMDLNAKASSAVTEGAAVDAALKGVTDAAADAASKVVTAEVAAVDSVAGAADLIKAASATHLAVAVVDLVVVAAADAVADTETSAATAAVDVAVAANAVAANVAADIPAV